MAFDLYNVYSFTNTVRVKNPDSVIIKKLSLNYSNNVCFIAV